MDWGSENFDRVICFRFRCFHITSRPPVPETKQADLDNHPWWLICLIDIKISGLQFTLCKIIIAKNFFESDVLRFYQSTTPCILSVFSFLCPLNLKFQLLEVEPILSFPELCYCWDIWVMICLKSHKQPDLRPLVASSNFMVSLVFWRDPFLGDWFWSKLCKLPTYRMNDFFCLRNDTAPYISVTSLLQK